MNRFHYKILHLISYLSSYILSFCLVFSIQNYTIGLIPPFRNMIIGNFYIKDLFFLISSFIIVYKYVIISTPYEKYLSK